MAKCAFWYRLVVKLVKCFPQASIHQPVFDKKIRTFPRLFEELLKLRTFPGPKDPWSKVRTFPGNKDRVGTLNKAQWNSAQISCAIHTSASLTHWLRHCSCWWSAMGVFFYITWHLCWEFAHFNVQRASDVNHCCLYFMCSRKININTVNWSYQLDIPSMPNGNTSWTCCHEHFYEDLPVFIRH